MLLIHTHRITNRIQYTFNVILKSVLGIEFEITTDAGTFDKFDGAKISYTEKPVGKELFFQSSNLLFETGIKATTPDLKDVFALTFYTITRYEEYLAFTPDHYGRFSAKQSHAHKNNFLHKPAVNIWAKEIRELISKRYPDFNFPEKKYRYTPTIDIDNAYAYLGKNYARTIGGYARALAKGNIDDLLRRKNVLAGKEKDPFDTYGLQIELHKKQHANVPPEGLSALTGGYVDYPTFTRGAIFRGCSAPHLAGGA